MFFLFTPKSYFYGSRLFVESHLTSSPQCFHLPNNIFVLFQPYVRVFSISLISTVRRTTCVIHT